MWFNRRNRRKLWFFQRCLPSNCRNDFFFPFSPSRNKRTILSIWIQFFSSQNQYLLHRKLYRKLPCQSFSIPKFWSRGRRWKSFLINPRIEGGKEGISHSQANLGQDRILVGSQPYSSPLWSQGVPSPLVWRIISALGKLKDYLRGLDFGRLCKWNMQSKWGHRYFLCFLGCFCVFLQADHVFQFVLSASGIQYIFHVIFFLPQLRLKKKMGGIQMAWKGFKDQKYNGENRVYFHTRWSCRQKTRSSCFPRNWYTAWSSCRKCIASGMWEARAESSSR